MRQSAGFGDIWVASGGHFGRLTGYSVSLADYHHAVAPWIRRPVQPERLLNQTAGTRRGANSRSRPATGRPVLDRKIGKADSSIISAEGINWQFGREHAGLAIS